MWLLWQILYAANLEQFRVYSQRICTESSKHNCIPHKFFGLILSFFLCMCVSSSQRAHGVWPTVFGLRVLGSRPRPVPLLQTLQPWPNLCGNLQPLWRVSYACACTHTDDKGTLCRCISDGHLWERVDFLYVNKVLSNIFNTFLWRIQGFLQCLIAKVSHLTRNKNHLH